ncbi:hypothetical protein MMYC01_202608 [Madurella mycetomatis]|uniref:Uncharacterized protein n=1 Tax=Madurella mycetomatis TaxID=100816 RepID=A0A175WA16_9PEZI|nr:hypothetical protein MMYC01_202608 [Madurella mycetomatis]
MPGRLTPGMGSAVFRPPYDMYPAPPHSDLLGAEDTAGTSTYRDDCSEFFDFELWEEHMSGKTTDVTTPSSVSPEEKFASSPSVPGPEGFTITGPNPGDDVPMSGVWAPEPQPSHVWPQVLGPQPPRDDALQLDSSHPTETRLGLPQPASSQSTSEVPLGHKKTRKVKNPDKTSQVRGLSACSWCRMNKSGVRSPRRSLPFRLTASSRILLVRHLLGLMIEAVYARWYWNDPDMLLPSRGQFSTSSRILFISLSENISSPCLDLTAHSFTLPNQRDRGVTGWGVMPETQCSLEGKIRTCVEGHILNDNRTDFEAHMDKLLYGLVPRQGQGPEMPETLLSNLSEMKSMWKIWHCKQFFVRKDRASRPLPLDLQCTSIHDSLRLFAAQKISELERKVLADIQKYIARKDVPGIPLTIKWLVLWQMIFIYRHSLIWMLEQQQTNAAPIPMMEMNEKRHGFRETTKQLLNAIIVIYAGHLGLFHKTTTLKHLRATGAEAFSGDLQVVFQNAWQRLPEFYNQVLGQVSPTDELFKAYIVDRESEFLATGRTARD